MKSMLAPALLVGGILGATLAGTAHAADLERTAGPEYLVLYSEPDLKGSNKPIETKPGCVPVNPPFRAKSAGISSPQFKAILFGTGNCTGTPQAELGPASWKNLPKEISVGSVSFVHSV
ncbi:hypothetical protein AGRA3207_006683 [Actinomadura graeca]|uniref:Uncharacterized protein n=1 Tax=Actinomadura graeca TaxID=2750812 RepID=A0ABX8R2D2_9ACTN|nr:hypothetical protein [Actinomadura graeca]QXJ25215.1 hypothetical protein AGRA3207_006683 [Actinomadura graeca]